MTDQMSPCAQSCKPLRCNSTHSRAVMCRLVCPDDVLTQNGSASPQEDRLLWHMQTPVGNTFMMYRLGVTTLMKGAWLNLK